MTKFCERFKELRKESGLFTIELCKKLKVSNSTITRWENGGILPSIEHLYNIYIQFNVSADYLIGLKEY